MKETDFENGRILWPDLDLGLAKKPHVTWHKVV